MITYCFGKEDTGWVVFLFDGVETGVVGSPESLLAVWFVDVGLKNGLARTWKGKTKKRESYLPQIAAGSRRYISPFLHTVIGEIGSNSVDGVQVPQGRVPPSGGDGVHNSISPCGID